MCSDPVRMYQFVRYRSYFIGGGGISDLGIAFLLGIYKSLIPYMTPEYSEGSLCLS